MLETRLTVGLREFELDVELSVGEGACLALAGPSGAGKSTILRAIAGVHRPDEGRVAVGGDVWFDSRAGVDVPPERRSCGYLFQHYALFPHLSAVRNVEFALRDTARSRRRPRALELLERFGVAGLADALPRDLSGGERQRVALARALARDPNLLLLDEPLGALDAQTAASAARELAEVINGSGVSTVLVTHDFAEAATLADEIAVIDRGRVVQRAEASDLSGRPASAFVADFAGAAVLTGRAEIADDAATRIVLDGGGVIFSSDRIEGRVAAAVYPWEVALEPVDARAVAGSALNRLEATVVTTTQIGNRVRVALSASQPFAAEITADSAGRLELAPKRRVAATWKATATRLISV